MVHLAILIKVVFNTIFYKILTFIYVGSSVVELVLIKFI